MSEFRIERLHKQDRSGFECGVEALDRYLQTQASQEVRRRYAVCYLLIEPSSKRIAGYYTLSAGSIPVVDLPSDLSQHLPRYPSVPVARIGRLAVDLKFRSRGLGGALLYDAVKRSSAGDLGVYAIVVDAKDEPAAGFYEHFGFLRLSSQPQVLFLPISEGLRKL